MDARELASCARDTDHYYGDPGKTSPNDRIPDADVCADGQGSDGRLHSIGSERSAGIEQQQVSRSSIAERCRMKLDIKYRWPEGFRPTSDRFMTKAGLQRNVDL
jgi:hypothetical protein